MPSSSDQFPDPWNVNRPDDNEESASELENETTSKDADDFGLAELEALLSDTASEEGLQTPEPSFDDLDSLFSLDADTSAPDQSLDFDAMLESLRQETTIEPASTLNFDGVSTDDVSTDIDTALNESEVSLDPQSLESQDVPASGANPEELIAEGLIADTGLSDLDLSDVDLSAPLSADLDPSALDPTATEPDLDLPSPLSSSEQSLIPESTLPEIDLGSPETIAPEPITPDPLAPPVPEEISPLTPSALGSISETGDEVVPDASGPVDDVLSEASGAEGISEDLDRLPTPNIDDISVSIPPLASITPDDVALPPLESLDVVEGEAPELPDSNISDPETVEFVSEETVLDTPSDVPSIPDTPAIPDTPTIPAESSLPGEPVSIPVIPDTTPPSVSSPTVSPPPTTGPVESPAPVAATSGTSGTATGSGTSTYKQILSGRQQISAFAIILAGMGGVTSYGLSKANLPNPLEAGLNAVDVGILADSETPSGNGALSDAPSNGTESNPAGTDADSTAIAQNQPGPSSTDPSAAITGLAPSSAAPPSNTTIPPVPNIGGIDESNALLEDDAPTDLGTADPDEAASELGDADVATADTPPPIDISDVPSDHWAHSYIVAMHEQGVIPDFPDGKFQPDKPVTRAELAASIQRAFTDPSGKDPVPFSDIPDGYWAKDAIIHSVNSGFMSGYSDDIFEPNQQIPRYQVLVSLVSGLGLQKIQDPQEAAQVLQAFPDVESMPEWALGQVAASKNADLIINQPQEENILAPTRPATRAEVSAMIYQALVNAGKIEDTAQ